MSDFRFDEREVRERASKFLLSDPPVAYGRSDDDLNPDLDLRLNEKNADAAAVLVPIIAREPEVTVMLTLRTAHLKAHAGQVAFPGGRIDRSDDNEIAAALREAESGTSWIATLLVSAPSCPAVSL